MDATKLAAIVGLLVALSAASERLVEIVKGLFKWLDQKSDDERTERLRKGNTSEPRSGSRYRDDATRPPGHTRGPAPGLWRSPCPSRARLSREWRLGLVELRPDVRPEGQGYQGRSRDRCGPKGEDRRRDCGGSARRRPAGGGNGETGRRSVIGRSRRHRVPRLASPETQPETVAARAGGAAAGGA